MRHTCIDLIRHGEPHGGVMIRGCHTDHALSPLGWQQMWTAIGDTAPWHHIISSPLARCREFASALAAHHQLPLAIEPLLHEIDMGNWEGRLHREIAANEPALFNAVCRDPLHYRPLGGESLTALVQRVGGVYDRLVALYPAKHVLVIAHAVVIRGIIGHVLHADPVCWYRMRIDYAGVTRICHDDIGPRVQYVNAKQVQD